MTTTIQTQLNEINKDKSIKDLLDTNGQYIDILKLKKGDKVICDKGFSDEKICTVLDVYITYYGMPLVKLGWNFRSKKDKKDKTLYYKEYDYTSRNINNGDFQIHTTN